MALFHSVDGSFGDYYVGAHAEKIYLGQISWESTQYTGSLVPPIILQPVAEPSIYGVFGSIALLGLAAVRKFKSKRWGASVPPSAATA